MDGVSLHFCHRAPEMRTRRQLIAGVAGAVLVTVSCAAIATATGALDVAARTLVLAPPRAWAGVLVLMIAVAGLRFLRLRTALGAPPPLETFNAAALHGSAAALLPGKLGELVLPLVVRRLTGQSILAGAGLLVFFRALDFAALVAAAAVAGMLAGGPAPLLAAILLAALAAPYLLHALARRPLGRKGGVWSLLANAADIAGRLSIARIATIFALTLAVWGALWAAALVAADGAGLSASAAIAGLALAAASAAFASPVNGIANAGPFEAAFAGVYAAFGHAAAPALAAAILVHACAVAAPLLCFALGEGAALALGVRPPSGAMR